MDVEEGTYSTIFNALRHPLRRRILKIIEQKPSTYTEILDELKIDNGLFNYHLDSLKELINKGENDKYHLSEFGRAALALTRNIEEPIRTSSPKSKQFSIRFVFVAFLVSIIILSGLLVNLNSNYVNLNSAFEQQKIRIDEQENEIWNLRELISRTSYLSELRNVSLSPGVSIVASYTISFDLNTFEGLRSYGVPSLVLYSPVDNLTLQIYFTNLPELMIFPLTLQQGRAFEKSENMILSKDEHNRSYSMAPIIWSFNITKNRTYYASIPSKGWYTLSLTGPIIIRDSLGISMSIGYIENEEAWNRTTQIRARADIKLFKEDEIILFAIWPQF